jgi:hypothetical protein
MSGKLDPKIAEPLADSAIGCINPERGTKIVCTRSTLQATILQAAQEAYEVGGLAGRKEQYEQLPAPDRPGWMEIPLDDAEALAEHKIRFKPVVLKSRLDSGYRHLGDLRWIPSRELTAFHYVSLKTAQQIRAVVRRFETLDNTESCLVRPGARLSGDLAMLAIRECFCP